MRSLIQSRKAQGTEIPIFGRKMIFFGITAVILGLLAVGYIMSTSAYIFKTTATPKELQQMLYVERMFNHPGCFAFQDPNTQRTYPSWIDVEKFTDEQFRNCLQFPLNKIDLCYELQLAKIDKTEQEEIKTIHSNNYQQACTSGTNKHVSKRPVIIVEGKKYSTGIMTLIEFNKD